jgi:diguanylate cyclase (GGDEF)-like protein
VLIDPCAPEEFEHLLPIIESVLPVGELSHIVLLQRSIDSSAAVPLFETYGFEGEVVCRMDAEPHIRFPELRSPLFRVEQHDFFLELENGRIFEFIPAPYLPAPSSLLMLDPSSGTLFSGELFGSLQGNGELSETDIRKSMEEFHRMVMPANEVLGPVMELLLQKEIDMICPGHGTVIDTEPRRYMETLRDLDCGTLLDPVRRALVEQGDYLFLLNMIIRRLLTYFGMEEVQQCFRDTPFILSEENGETVDFRGKTESIWDSFFDYIYAYGGTRWLTLIEPLLKRFDKEYGITLPDIYLGELASEKRRSLGLEGEKEHLEKINENLLNKLELTQDEMTKDPVTGLYNEDFLVRYLLNIFNEETWDDFTTLFVQIDNMKQINNSIGEFEGDEVINGVGNLLLQRKEEEEYLFRISGPVFVLILPETEDETVAERAEYLRGIVEKDRGFLARVTVTIAAVPVPFGKMAKNPAVEAMNYIFSRGRAVLRDSLRDGPNQVVFDTGGEKREGTEGRVLIAEFDSFHAELIRDALKRLSIDVRMCLNGPEIVRMVEEFHPDVIVSELFLPETDAFTVREELQSNTKTKDIPFILLSHQKNESSVVRALNLGILHYLKKPYMLPELMGIINSYVERALRHGT